MAALGVQRDYIEYMMGHTISTYHDIRMKGVDFLKGVYTASGLSIRPKTKPNRIEILKEIAKAIGLNPEEILTREALAKPHRTVVTSGEKPDLEQNKIDTLLTALKQQLRQDFTSEPADTTQKTV